MSKVNTETFGPSLAAENGAESESAEPISGDFFGALDELEGESRDALERFARLLQPHRGPISPRQDILSEGCQAAWDGFHRNIAEGGNAHME